MDFKTSIFSEYKTQSEKMDILKITHSQPALSDFSQSPLTRFVETVKPPYCLRPPSLSDF